MKYHVSEVDPTILPDPFKNYADILQVICKSIPAIRK